MKLKGRDMWDTQWGYCEVWYSPSAFTKDDAKSQGFVKVAKGNDFGRSAERELVERLNRDKAQGRKCWTISVISTRFLDQWSKDWNKEIEFPEFKR